MTEMGKNFSELLEARRRVKALEESNALLLALLAELEAEQGQPPKPEIELLSMSGMVVKNEMTAKELTLMYPTLMDGPTPYFYTNDEGWAEVVDYIYAVFNMPPYIAARMDCEDFAILLKGLVSALFGLNYFALTVGQIPRGCHGFNFLRSQDRLVVFEPQLARFQEWGELGYRPQYVLL